MIKTNTLVSIVTPAGEFVGKLESQTDTHVTLRTPKMIVHSEDQKMGFARGVCLTGKENPEVVTFSAGGIIFITPSNDDIVAAYKKMTTPEPSIITPEKSIIV
jgi:predicted neuraminidase